MSIAHTHVRPNTWLFLRLPSDSLKLVEIKPDTIIDVGKLGSFPSNLLLGRPYYFAYEVLDKTGDEAYSRLRVVPPSELNAEITAEEATPSESRSEPDLASTTDVPESYDLLSEDRTVVLKNNRLTIDDSTRQALSQEDIEELKKTSAGRDVIEKILANHAGLDEKTAFSKAKYTLRKTKKYLKRFTVLPMELGSLLKHITDKDAPRIMELREETLGLLMAWSHAHLYESDHSKAEMEGKRVGGGRWVALDDTGGLVVAALAERMGTLYSDHDSALDQVNGVPQTNGDTFSEPPHPGSVDNTSLPSEQPQPTDVKPALHRDFPIPAPTNSITLLHPAVQPNVSLLKYFGYDTNQPDTDHPLHTHLKPLSWLQLLHAEEDPTYREPEDVAEDVLQTWKSGKRGTHFKKRRRWERCRSIVDETREGGFDGLVIASNMDPMTILPHTIPLVRGGGTVVIFSPNSEPLVKVADYYSKDRRTAYINQRLKGETPDSEDFPVDPRLLLAPTLQTTRAREWQVLPGRTHPLMTSRGGAEGYVFTARKVVPLEGGVEARGNFGGKKRKIDPSSEGGVMVNGDQQ